MLYEEIPSEIRQLAEMTAELVGETGREVEVSFGPSRPGDLAAQTVRSDAAVEILGWEPQVQIDEGMRRSFDWYVANRVAPAD